MRPRAYAECPARSSLLSSSSVSPPASPSHPNDRTRAAAPPAPPNLQTAQHRVPASTRRGRRQKSPELRNTGRPVPRDSTQYLERPVWLGGFQYKVYCWAPLDPRAGTAQSVPDKL
eukprot:3355544-Rhodomonas_salina.2